MAINERLVHTASAAGGGTGNQEEGLILHLDANDVDSYDGDGDIWYDIHDHEYTPATNVSEHFNTVTYTGTGGTNPITGVGFQPDLVWIKNRSNSAGYFHAIIDSIRGTNKVLSSNASSIDSTSYTQQLTSFDSNGFSLGDNSDSGNYVNLSGDDYVAWCFNAGGNEVTNTEGTIDSTVRANNDLGFSIAKYTATGVTATVGHGLDTPPEMIIAKTTNQAYNWMVYHKDLGASNYLMLNSRNASASSSAFMNNTSPTSSVFTVGAGQNLNYANNDEIVAYNFTSKRGVSKVGSYIGNGSTNNKIYTGFEPAFLMIKNTSRDNTGWLIKDNVRGENSKTILANSNAVEYNTTAYWTCDFERDGVRLTYGADNEFNRNGDTYIFYAVAKNTNETELSTTSSGVWSGFQNAVTSITSDSTHTSLAPGTADTATTSSIFDTVSQISMGNNGTAEANNEMFITLDAAKSVKGFAVYEKFSSGYRYTGTTKLYGSTDNSNWNLLGSTVQNTNIEYNRNETTFTASPEYQYYKFTLSANTRGTYQNAWAFELIADFDITPSLHLDAANFDGSTNTPTTWTALTGSNGTITGATYDGELGNFLNISSDSTYIDVATANMLDSDFTIEMWYNLNSTSSSYKMLLGGSGYSSQTGLGHYIYGDTLKTWVSISGATTNVLTSQSALIANKWHHIVLKREGSNWKQYVDGEEVGTATGTTSGLSSANSRIGRHYNSTGLSAPGKIGQVRIYSTALPETQVRQNFNFTKSSYPNEFHGDISGATWNAGGYFDFNGTNSKVDLGTSFANNASQATYAAWVNFDNLNTQNFIIFPDSGSTGHGFGFFDYGNGNIYFQSDNGTNSNRGVVSNSGLYTAGSWVHMAQVYDGSATGNASRLKAYINGNPVTLTFSGTIPSTTGTTSYNTLVGTRVMNNYSLDGKISKVHIYDKALTQAEITALYNEGE